MAAYVPGPLQGDKDGCLSVVLAGLAVLLALATSMGVALAVHQITSTVTVEGGYTTATYAVINEDGNAISHVVIPGCYQISPTITGCSGAIEYGADPTTGITGWKCDSGGSYTLQFVWPGELVTETQTAAIKAGAGFQLVPVEAVTCVPQNDEDPPPSAVTVSSFSAGGGPSLWQMLFRWLEAIL